MRRPAVLALAASILLVACSSTGGDGVLFEVSRDEPARPPVAGPAPAPAAQSPPADESPPVGAPALPLNGCPPPPPRAGSGGTTTAPPFVPPRLVPEAELPEPLAPGQWSSHLAPLEGKGMWLWKYFQSEGGNPDAIVAKAADAGLRQLWVRVGDSKDGFYAKGVLDALVPRAHRRGIAVIGWGFPFLHDPVGDAQWSAQALAWRSPAGDALDGFSPDIELATEGVALSARRAQVYLGLVRKAAGSRLVVATVYRPSDRLWPATYPYGAITPYVDAFAPMVYWGCLEPGQTAIEAVERLGTLRPVHVIGQGWDMSFDGGRGAAPDALETRRFLDSARRQGALGGSFWVWHLMAAEQWSSLAAFAWPVATAGG